MANKKRYRDHAVMAKLYEMKVKDFSEAELKRAFAGVVGFEACMKRTRRMIDQGLTIRELFRTKWYEKKEYTRIE